MDIRADYVRWWTDGRVYFQLVIQYKFQNIEPITWRFFWEGIFQGRSNETLQYRYCYCRRSHARAISQPVWGNHPRRWRWTGCIDCHRSYLQRDLCDLTTSGDVCLMYCLIPIFSSLTTFSSLKFAPCKSRICTGELKQSCSSWLFTGNIFTKVIYNTNAFKAFVLLSKIYTTLIIVKSSICGSRLLRKRRC